MHVVRRVHLQARDLRHALEDTVAEDRLREEVEECADDVALEDVSEGDPREVGRERLERGLDELGLSAVGQRVDAQVVHKAELVVEGPLELLHLGLGEISSGKVKDLLAQEPQHVHAVLAQRLARLGRLHDVRNEARPLARPVVLQNVNQDHIQLVDEELLPPASRLVAAHLDDDVAYVVPNRLPLLFGQGAPPKPNEIFHDLKCEETRLLVLACFQDSVHASPHLRVLLHLLQKLPDLGSLRLVRRGVKAVHGGVQQRHVERLVEVE
mmetsp:Transcript_17892/g.36785  ORF Transcript_17892/g.36785 Transcript_17892/m.36785 type:complete len:268 (-) Transcript_17892:82-885(-)